MADDLRLARNLVILAPFHRSARDRVSTTLTGIAQRIRADRLQVAQLEVCIDILQRDQEAEDREFSRLRHVALQAAAKSLRDPGGVKSVVEDAQKGQRAIPIPTFSLSSNEDETGEHKGPANNDRTEARPLGGASSAPMESTQSGSDYFVNSPDKLTPAGEVSDPFGASNTMMRQLSRGSNASWKTGSSRPASPAGLEAVARSEKEEKDSEKEYLTSPPPEVDDGASSFSGDIASTGEAGSAMAKPGSI